MGLFNKIRDYYMRKRLFNPNPRMAKPLNPRRLHRAIQEEKKMLR